MILTAVFAFFFVLAVVASLFTVAILLAPLIGHAVEWYWEWFEERWRDSRRR